MNHFPIIIEHLNRFRAKMIRLRTKIDGLQWSDADGHCSCPVLIWFLSWFPKDRVRCLSAVRILSGLWEKMLSVVCLPGRTRTRQSCPDSHCPCPSKSDSDVGDNVKLLTLWWQQIPVFGDRITLLATFLLWRFLNVLNLSPTC